MTGNKKIFAICALSLVACASDNVHMPAPEEVRPDVHATGEIVSSIPDFPFFEAIHNDDTASLLWTNATGTRASVVVGAFSLYVNVVDLHISIGEMRIDNVAVTYGPDGSATLQQPAFECQAGQYFTKGSLVGEYFPANDSLTITLDYKPGSMPFIVHSQFFGKQ